VGAPTGVPGFIAGLGDCGLTAVTQHGVVTFAMVPVAGGQAGSEVPVGVAVDELGGWPAVPPHWVHLPNMISFAATNAQPSTIPGWTKHSRGTATWGDAAHPVQAYLAHLRGVLGDAS
jgi:hypothetical protein